MTGHSLLSPLRAPAPARKPVRETLRRWLVARAMAPITIDGDEVEAVTIDGEEVDKVTIDGETAYERVAIPDSENLHAQYDFSQEDGTLPVSDQSGNGYDLDTGQYTGVAATINGVQAGEFDGVDDAVYGPSFSSIDAYTIYVVESLASTGSDTTVVNVNASQANYIRWDDANEWRIFGGGSVAAGSSDDTTQLLSRIQNADGSGALREDGTQTASGSNVDTSGMTDIAVGFQESESTNYWDGAIGEVLIYNTAHDSTTVSEVESYLADKWGVTL